MRRIRALWSFLRPGDLFQTRDDRFPVQVVALHPRGVWIAKRRIVELVIFRAGVVVDMYLRR